MEYFTNTLETSIPFASAGCASLLSAYAAALLLTERSVTLRSHSSI
jgi:hypothetical protein